MGGAGPTGDTGPAGEDGANGTNGYNSLIKVSSYPGTLTTIDFASASGTGGALLVSALGTNLTFVATDTIASTTPTGGWSAYVYNINGYHNSRIIRPQTNALFYVIYTEDGSQTSFNSIELLDDGNWATANVHFYAYKDGVQTGSETRAGDIPYSGASDAVSYTFLDLAFADADMIVIAPRQADGTSATPLGLDNLSVGSACGAGSKLLESGLDNGDGGGIANDGILQAGEVDATDQICF